MITGEHAVIRTAEADDAYELKRLYDPFRPSSSMLDRARDMTIPTLDELRELLTRKDKQAGALYTVENKRGEIRGLCGIRGIHQDARYGELLLTLFSDEDFESPLADEVFDFLYERAFQEKRLNKMSAHCLEDEHALRNFLLRKGFQSNGVQRDVLFTRGEWLDLESLTLFGPRSERSLDGDTKGPYEFSRADPVG